MVSVRRRRRHLGSAKSPVVEPPLPEGWTLSTDVNPDGEIVKVYKLCVCVCVCLHACACV